MTEDMARSRTAVLDLGSNSFHVLVAEIDGHSLSPVLRSRQMLHLGRQVEREGKLGDAARRAAADTAAHLADLARRAGATQVVAIATSAIRDAADRAATLDAMRTATRLDVQVIDGDEEARLSHLGACMAVALDDDPALVIDFGGGSMECAVGPRWAAQRTISVALGASRLSALVTSDPPSTHDLAVIDARIDRATEHLGEVIGDLPATTVLIGGTVRAIARLIAAQTGRWLPSSVNKMPLTADDMARLAADLTHANLEQRSALAGMSSRRADHLHVAAHTLSRVMRNLGLHEVIISDWGLREGVIVDHAMTPHATDPHDLPLPAAALRQAEIERIHTTMAPTDRHGPHIANLAGQIFDQTVALHNLDADDRDLLTFAATLHLIGRVVNLRRQQDHGAYLVEHAEMRGFSPNECGMLSTLVRFHPSRAIAAHWPAYSAMSEADQRRTRTLLALLQLADTLDAAHDQAVTDIHVKVDIAARRLIVDTGAATPHITAADLDRRTALLADDFGLTVELTSDAPSSPPQAAQRRSPDPA